MQKLTHFQLILFVLFTSLLASAGTAFQPTTTLAKETGPNTSAALSFTAQSDGNIAGTNNISKVPVRNLLYPGSTAKIYAQFLPWFGFGDHINVGYNSNDVLQVQKQVTDMASRGLDGAIIDWYGRGTSNSHFVSYDQASQDLMHEAEQHAGFNFAIQHDAVALKGCGCDVTQALIDDLNYANTTYWNSPAYQHYNGRPVVYFFGHEAYPIDWNRVRTSVAGNPMFIFRNAGGFTRAQSSGAFSWIEPTTSGFSYLDNYYSTARSLPSDFSVGSAYKGFDDSLAVWGSHRLTAQQCGQTWLNSMAEAGKYYSAANQMLGIQMVTWNDYEEGSELETGIDNCVSVSASANGTVVSWSITGQANTLDHFEVFVSQNGQDLMLLGQAPPTATSLDLATFGLDPASYTVFVKAVGKPMLTNKMSGGTQVTISGPPPPSSSNLSVSTPAGTTATVKAGQTATYQLQLAASGGPLSVSISCAGAPPNAACNGPAGSLTVTPGTPSTVNVSVSTTAKASMFPGFRLKAPPAAFWLILALAPFGLVAQKFLLAPRKRKFSLKPAFAAPLLLLAMLTVATGCGGKASASSAKPSPTPAPTPTPTAGTPAGSYTVVVTATSGSITRTSQLTLNVQ